MAGIGSGAISNENKLLIITLIPAAGVGKYVGIDEAGAPAAGRTKDERYREREWQAEPAASRPPSDLPGNSSGPSGMRPPESRTAPGSKKRDGIAGPVFRDIRLT